MYFSEVYGGRRVLITGHTGFKGSWLAEWLLMLGADVSGFALNPPTHPSHYEQLGLGSRLTRDLRGDVRNFETVLEAVRAVRPEFVFHLAAQPLVLQGYRDPLETFATNTLGTANLLEASRREARPCIVIAVTTDKCYENHEWMYGYREDDRLGGHDPYSASKAAAELVVSAFRSSYFQSRPDDASKLPIWVATGRAGNVIGGGDWAGDRIVPDCIRNLSVGKPILVRNPSSIRPWQHVLESLQGYLLLAASISDAVASGRSAKGQGLGGLCSSFNFGPSLESLKSVEELVGEMLAHWPGTWERVEAAGRPHEAGRLHLNTDKAFALLGWRPRWSFERMILETVAWYRAALTGDADIRELTLDQIRRYSTAEK